MCVCKYKQRFFLRNVSAVFKQKCNFHTARAHFISLTKNCALFFRSRDRVHSNNTCDMQITMYSYYWFLRIALHFIFAPMLLKLFLICLFCFRCSQFSARKTAQESVVRRPVSGRVGLALESSAEETPSRKRRLRCRSL